MKLANCRFDFSTVSMAPLARSEPEEKWVQGRSEGSIPEPLFDLYKRASYLSFGAAPPFLGDQDNILFSYFCMMVRSLSACSLVSIKETRTSLKQKITNTIQANR
jgi:hypothetical protein